MIANTGTYDTAHSVHLTREAVRLGVDGFLAVTPYYNKPPAEGLARHFAAIAAAADGLPVIIYNIPQRVHPQSRAGAARRGSRARARTSSRSSRRRPTSTRRARILDGGLVLYAGNDDLLAPFLELGGIGGICVASHLVGRARCCACASWPRPATSTAFARSTASSRRSSTRSSVTTNPIPLKAALELLGLRVGRAAPAAGRGDRGATRRAALRA